KVFDDGAQAVIDTIQTSPEPVTIIAIAPAPNLAEVLRRAPQVAEKVRFVGMFGAVHKGYGGSNDVTPEYNVRTEIPAAQAVFTAPWDMTITPLDTCGIAILRGDKYARIFNSDDPLLKAVIENYQLWAPRVKWFAEQKVNVHERSSVLFDPVAV